MSLRGSLRASVLIGCAGVASIPAGATAAEPAPVPAAVRPPAGAKLVAKLHATGAQVYGCAASTSGPPAWTLKRPEATLFDASGASVGAHGAGPTWTSKDGSAVVGEKLAQADAPAASAVPWLLLKAKSTSGAGQFGPVTYVQRLDTSGGKAPATGCDASKLGAEVRVDYSADYLFYSGATAATKAAH
jgi:Protein of unknown function (DUF3455)